ncbi:Uncharacterised protein [Escherichia coli]|nr:Uncharacterised protein [Escherichia coli]VVY74170.1 Uncharacterised protein [Escherichia coli]
MALRIRHSDKPRAFVVEPGRLRAGTVRVPHELPVFIPLEVFIPPARIRYLHHLTVAVILIPGVLLQRVGHGKKVAAFIVHTAPGVSRRVHLRFRLVPHRVPLCLRHPPQRVVRLRDMPLPVIHIAPFAALSIRNSQQQSFFVAPAECHHLSGFVLVTGYLVLRIPPEMSRTPRAVRHAQPALRHVPVQAVLFTAVRVVARYPPRRIIRTFIPVPIYNIAVYRSASAVS